MPIATRPVFNRTGYLFMLVLMIPLSLAVALDADPRLEDPSQQALYEKLTNEVRCLVCQNQTIADSGAPLAKDLRREIREKIEQGQTEKQIKDFLTERYGDFVLYRPPLGGPTSLLWLAPGLLLLVGGIVLLNVLRRRAALPVTTEAEDAIDPAETGPGRD